MVRSPAPTAGARVASARARHLSQAGNCAVARAVGSRRTPALPAAHHLARQHRDGNHAIAQVLSTFRAPVLQRMRLKPHKSKGYVKAGDMDERGVIETRHASPSERDTLSETLKRNPELGKLVKAEWANLAGDTTPGSLHDLNAIGDELDALRRKPKRDRVDERRLRDIALLLVKASQAPPEDEGEAMLQRELIASYRSQVGNLSKAANKLALALGAGELDLNVLQVEKAVYREDIKQLGVWGGLAEAETAATFMQLSCTIFVVDTNGNYQAVDRIGGNNPVNGRDLLFRGNHYEMVQGAVAGQAHLPAHVQLATEPDGNCLFEGLILVRDGVKPPPVARLRMIRRLRRKVSANITDQQVETSMLEVLLSGDSPGLGLGQARPDRPRGDGRQRARVLRRAGNPASAERPRRLCPVGCLRARAYEGSRVGGDCDGARVTRAPRRNASARQGSPPGRRAGGHRREAVRGARGAETGADPQPAQDRRIAPQQPAGTDRERRAGVRDRPARAARAAHPRAQHLTEKLQGAEGSQRHLSVGDQPHRQWCAGRRRGRRRQRHQAGELGDAPRAGSQAVTVPLGHDDQGGSQEPAGSGLR